MQSSSEQPLVGEERYVTTRITAAKETTRPLAKVIGERRDWNETVQSSKLSWFK